MKQFVKNREVFQSDTLHKHALELIETAYAAIDTDSRLKEILSYDGRMFTIGTQVYDMQKYRRVYIIGVGKASAKAAQSIEDCIDGAITGGIILDKTPGICRRVDVFAGAHPLPGEYNVEISEKIATLARELTEEDLAIVIVSGGGSALLCWPQSEYEQGARLYTSFLSAGGTISELNVLRRHLSGMKGGGLAKLLYPASVVGLIFCDVPGGHYDVVASGPTYYDETTIKDAEAIIKKYNITEQFSFIETPKEKKYFERVVNIPIVSNREALTAITDRAQMLGYEVHSLGEECYDDPETLIKKMCEKISPRSVVIAGGEITMTIPHAAGGVGGRNEYISGCMIASLPERSIFCSFASDGIDNCSIAAGGVIDARVKERVLRDGVDVSHYLATYNHDELLKTLEAQLITGVTGSNVSDIYLLIQE